MNSTPASPTSSSKPTNQPNDRRFLALNVRWAAGYRSCACDLGADYHQESEVMIDTEYTLGGKILWRDLAIQLSKVWWDVTQVGGELQHGDLEYPECMFSIVLKNHGGQCFHAETPMDAWKKAHDWLVSPDRPTFLPDSP